MSMFDPVLWIWVAGDYIIGSWCLVRHTYDLGMSSVQFTSYGSTLATIFTWYITGHYAIVKYCPVKYWPIIVLSSYILTVLYYKHNVRDSFDMLGSKRTFSFGLGYLPLSVCRWLAVSMSAQQVQRETNKIYCQWDCVDPKDPSFLIEVSIINLF